MKRKDRSNDRPGKSHRDGTHRRMHADRQKVQYISQIHRGHMWKTDLDA